MRFFRAILLLSFVVSLIPLAANAQNEDPCPQKPPEGKLVITYQIIIDLKKDQIDSLSACATYEDCRSTSIKDAIGPFEKGSLVKIMISERSGGNFKAIANKLYSLEVSPSSSPVTALAVYQGGEQAKIKKITEAEVPPKTLLIFYVPLKDAGQQYSIKITRFNSLDDKLLGKDGRIVFTNSVSTFNRYYFGFNAGIFASDKPRSKSYNLFYSDPSDGSDAARPSIKEDISRKYKTILFLSYYPLGFEPEKGGAFQLNIGTELSSSIMDNIYIGVGYAWKYVSLNIFAASCIEKELPANYSNNMTINNKNIDSLPLLDKRQNIYFGIAISFPINIASELLGKIIGL